MHLQVLWLLSNKNIWQSPKLLDCNIWLCFTLALPKYKTEKSLSIPKEYTLLHISTYFNLRFQGGVYYGIRRQDQAMSKQKMDIGYTLILKLKIVLFSSGERRHIIKLLQLASIITHFSLRIGHQLFFARTHLVNSWRKPRMAISNTNNCEYATSNKQVNDITKQDGWDLETIIENKW